MVRLQPPLLQLQLVKPRLPHLRALDQAPVPVLLQAQAALQLVLDLVQAQVPKLRQHLVLHQARLPQVQAQAQEPMHLLKVQMVLQLALVQDLARPLRPVQVVLQPVPDLVQVQARMQAQCPQPALPVLLQLVPLQQEQAA